MFSEMNHAAISPMKKVLFLHPPTPKHIKVSRNTDCGAESKGNYMWQPFDFLLLSGTFTPDFEIDFLDAVARKLSFEETKARIAKENYHLIFFAMADVVWEMDYEHLLEIRKIFLDVPIFVFGDCFLENYHCELVKDIADGILVSPVLFKPDCLTQFSRNEIREKFDHLGLKKRNSDKLASKTPVLHRGLLPRHELFLHSRYRWPFARARRYSTIHSVWGCPYLCSYCPVSRLNLIYKPAENVLEEIKKVVGLGVHEIYFGDKSFGVPLENTKNFLRLIKDQKIQISWSTYFHPNQYDEELLVLMQQTGCHTIIIGVETAEVKALKRFNRNVIPGSIEKLLITCRKLKIDVCADFIFGLDGEDLAQAKRTLKYAIHAGFDFASFNIASPIPGSSIRRIAVANGRMLPSDHRYNLARHTKLLANDKISPRQLRNLRTQAILQFYLRPGYLMRRLLKIRNLEHLRIQVEEMFGILAKSF